MSEVTQILSAIERGDPHAASQLLPLVYDELRRLAAQKLAREAPGQTLGATALVPCQVVFDGYRTNNSFRSILRKELWFW